MKWRDLDAPVVGPETPAARACVEALRGRAKRTKTREAPVSVTTDARRLLRLAVDQLGLSARGVHRVLRVAETVADLGGEARVGSDAVAEALGYRSEPRSALV